MVNKRINGQELTVEEYKQTFDYLFSEIENNNNSNKRSFQFNKIISIRKFIINEYMEIKSKGARRTSKILSEKARSNNNVCNKKHES